MYAPPTLRFIVICTALSVRLPFRLPPSFTLATHLFGQTTGVDPPPNQYIIHGLPFYDVKGISVPSPDTMTEARLRLGKEKGNEDTLPRDRGSTQSRLYMGLGHRRP
ncbi:hypothetical protein VNI00_017365 [Paramarasmius palmivorus]|uniref:Uncharacterized protein n=1 Tax=Paramarasmius palmivorus TaxID=297713 RepID=A0AAW0B6L4_9AGAR